MGSMRVKEKKSPCSSVCEQGYWEASDNKAKLTEPSIALILILYHYLSRNDQSLTNVNVV